MRYRPIPPLIQLRHFVRTILTIGLGGAIVDFNKRLSRSLRNYGFSGTIRRFIHNDRKRPKEARPTPTHPFDLLHGTETGGLIEAANLSAISLSAIYTTAYVGATPSALTQALSSLPIRYGDFTFVDLGCGKGRALLVAAKFPFRRLLGVEIVSEFCDIAGANVAADPERVARISIINQDAMKVIYPARPLLVFLFDPFVAPALKRVLKNLERQLRRSPRTTYILYERNPRTPDVTRVIDSFAFLIELSDTAYSFSAEDAASDPFKRTEERFTLYSAELP